MSYLALLSVLYVLPILIILFITTIFKIFFDNKNRSDPERIKQINSRIRLSRIISIGIFICIMLPAIIISLGDNMLATPIYYPASFNDGTAIPPLIILLLFIGVSFMARRQQKPTDKWVVWLGGAFWPLILATVVFIITTIVIYSSDL
jgi:ribose/xylose/arabinose/galactoside ABC-type transport system permease subunit